MISARPGAAGRGASATAIVLGAAGGAALVGAAAAEISDRYPDVEAVLGVAAGVLLVSAAAMVPGGRRRIDLLLTASAAAALAVAGLAKSVSGWIALLALPVLAVLLLTVQQARRLAAATRELERQQLRARVEGEERERRRWARELHDETLQDLGALQLLLSSAAQVGDPAAMREAIGDARQLVTHQVASLRHLITELRPAALDDLGLAPAVEALARRARELSDLEVQVSVRTRADRLPSEVEDTVYRVVQEALTNALRHAEASRVEICVEEGERAVEATVRDDGRGLVDAGSGFGLVSMSERAALLAGSLSVTDAPDGGTLVRLVVPCERPSALPTPPAREGTTYRDPQLLADT